MTLRSFDNEFFVNYIKLYIAFIIMFRLIFVYFYNVIHFV